MSKAISLTRLIIILNI